MAAYTAIDDPTLYFSATLYTGDGANDRAVTVAGTGMQPDMVWIKWRSVGEGHVLGDAVRGVNRKLVPNDTDAESSGSSYTNISTITSTGFTLSATGGGVDDAVIKDTATYVAWCWKETATAGFDIVAYTGNGSNRTIAHSLSAVPKMIFVKTRDATSSWQVYHESMGNTKFLELNTTTAQQDEANRWQDTTPTSSVFSIGDDAAMNEDGTTYISYLFSEKQGFSKFGSYEGNGNAEGPFVYTGFRPAYIVTKAIDTTSNWYIFDNKRPADSNPCHDYVKANANAAEDTDDADVGLDFLSNGFKLRGDNAVVNGVETYVYIAFAESPFVNSNGVPGNAR